jgi:hypothetical protein
MGPLWAWISGPHVQNCEAYHTDEANVRKVADAFASIQKDDAKWSLALRRKLDKEAVRP